MKLTQPVSIGNLTLKNRMVMAPMGVDLGNYDERTRAYYLARAKGGIGMILCNTLATPEIEGMCPSSLLDADSYEDFRDMTENAHRFNCRVCVQIHPGNGRITTPPPGRDKPLGASAVPWMDPRVICEEITRDEIRIIEDGFRRTARYAKKAGADAIEIHAYGGYLTDQFLTKRWNVRTDEYGGDLTGRMRFLTDLIEIVKTDLGEDFPLIVKFTPCHYLPAEAGYRDMDEGLEIARRLEALGVHALHVDAGCHDNWFMAMPPVYQQEQVLQLRSAHAVRNAVGIPVISHGRLNNISKAEYALEHGDLDIVAIGRGLLDDPELPNKLTAHETDKIRPCISCNEGCIARVCAGQSVQCAVNPNAGLEGVNDLKPAEAPKKVLVVGAGPAGCTAAITAARAGHQVELWEKRERIGGNVLAASRPSFKADMANLLSYYQNELTRLQVPVKFCMEADKAAVDTLKPDVVIWAAGGRPIAPGSIEGIHGDNVCTAIDALLNNALLGENIAVIGGGLVGLETAVDLTQRGKKVTVVEMAPKLLPEPVFMQNMMMIMGLVKKYQIPSQVNTKLLKIEPDGIVVQKENGEEKIPCDTVVLAMGFRPDDSVYEEIAGDYKTVKVGDCVSARKVYNAVHEAYDAVREL